jgi:hypothetical protein
MDVKRGSASNSIFSGKKAQVTVFIIVGILILFIVAGVLYFTRTSVMGELEVEASYQLEDVPQEFKPIVTYTEQCLEQIGKKSIKILGQQGGYIYPDLVGKYSVNDPTNGDGLSLDPLRVPYWHYNSEPNTGDKIIFSSLQPKLYYNEDPEMSIEAQLSRYVKEHLDECLMNYQPFNQQGIELEVSTDQDVSARVGMDGVFFKLDKSVKAKKGDSDIQFDNFVSEVKIPLKKYYDVAAGMVDAEREFNFLEAHSMNLISIFSGVDPVKLPPIYEVDFEMAPQAYWNKVAVKENVKRVLNSYVPMLRYFGSSNFYDYVYPVQEYSDVFQATYDQMVLPLGGAENFEVRFDYFDWEPYLDTNSVSDTISPNNVFVNYKVLLFSMQTYNNKYDLSYPVLVTLNNENELEGEGFSFNFALEANVRNNYPAEPDQILTPESQPLSSLACEKSQWNTEMLRTIVIDSYTKEPLEMVRLGFSIPQQTDCDVGFTDENGAAESTLPPVYGGVVNFIKEDYLTNFYPIDTVKNVESSGIIGYAVGGIPDPVIEMHQYKKINVSVKKKNFFKCFKKGEMVDCPGKGLMVPLNEPVFTIKPEMLSSKHQYYFSDIAQPLENYEDALITIERVRGLNENDFGEEFTQTISVNGKNSVEIELVPGIYKVNGMLTQDKEIIIPKSERCTGGVVESLACWNPDGCCFDFNETVLDKYLSGQLKWDKESAYWIITPEDVYASNSITFYMPNHDLRGVPELENYRVVEDLQMMGEMEFLSSRSDIRDALKPRFIS